MSDPDGLSPERIERLAIELNKQVKALCIRLDGPVHPDHRGYQPFSFGDEHTTIRRDMLQKSVRIMQEAAALLTAQAATIAQLQQRISESAVNCPSCGRHDFGLGVMAAGLMTKLKEECEAQHTRADKAEATIAQLQQRLATLLDHYTSLINSGDCGCWD